MLKFYFQSEKLKTTQRNRSFCFVIYLNISNLKREKKVADRIIRNQKCRLKRISCSEGLKAFLKTGSVLLENIFPFVSVSYLCDSHFNHAKMFMKSALKNEDKHESRNFKFNLIYLLSKLSKKQKLSQLQDNETLLQLVVQI